MKSHSDGLWPNLLPSKLKRLPKPEKLLASHIERTGNLASETFHDSAIAAREQSVSPKSEDIPFEEGGDLEDEVGVNHFKMQLAVLCFYTLAR